MLPKRSLSFAVGPNSLSSSLGTLCLLARYNSSIFAALFSELFSTFLRAEAVCMAHPTKSAHSMLDRVISTTSKWRSPRGVAASTLSPTKWPRIAFRRGTGSKCSVAGIGLVRTQQLIGHLFARIQVEQSHHRAKRRPIRVNLRAIDDVGPAEHAVQPPDPPEQKARFLSGGM